MRWPDVRPLDPVRSIKVKLGVLVAASIGAASMLTWLAIAVLGWPGRYAVAVALLLALGVTQVLAHGMTSPLRRMTAAARAMAAGSPVPPLHVTSRDEVGELAAAFTAMAADVAAAEARRRELLANLAHELRTPVAALRAQMENLVDGVRPADEAGLAEVLTQVERLGELIDDLLGLARAEAGTVSVHREPTELLGLASDVVAEARSRRPDREILVQVPPGLRVSVDPRRTRQILSNLVDNATRHSPAGGQVTLRAALRAPDDALVIEVSDSGPGIPAGLRSEVFERFRHGAITGPLPRIGEPGTPAPGGPTSAAPSGGTGLGLAIARWAAALHGGSVEVVDAAHGCVMRVVLPPS